jgi:septal ring-binding cell division protein DamX
MRKFILITAMVLAFTTAQAADKSLTLGSDTPVAAPARAADMSRVAETPKPVEATTPVETPNANETPKYVERPALVEPKTEQPKAEVEAEVKAEIKTEPASTQSAKPAVHKTASAPRSGKRRSHEHYWTEGRIISELRRHGIYW